METDYLKFFQENPRSDLNNPDTVPNTGMNVQQIRELEQLWNYGNAFPAVVKEFLLIGGVYNWIFEGDQKWLRILIDGYCRQINYSIVRPFLAITKSFSDPQFFIVFLDKTRLILMFMSLIFIRMMIFSITEFTDWKRRVLNFHKPLTGRFTSIETYNRQAYYEMFIHSD